ncbi:alpha/beta hydrolase [Pontibaca methylaminivorans]|uniref:Acetyl esterase/lipase n=1 Tax=Pontibaca methylaminivorans TaxID=515897 RepID=A0A1R3WXQ4_9RHOB|nr:alpha/beta hydrolase [Pontibaca methylaminivorans]SIT82925.1 Acetyl esterase/lipase [Pontibaca methylaminivorans]
MSWQRFVLNRLLRWIEKPALARADEPLELRRRFENRMRRWARPPPGSRLSRGDLAGLPALRIDPAWQAEGVILYLHGGAYILGSPDTHAALAANLVRRSGMRAWLPAYRLAPEHAFPAAFDDALTAYRALLDAGTTPERIILGGDSAGGGLALALIAALPARSLPLPRAVFAFSPLADMSFSGKSFRGNARAEAMLPAGRAADMARLYLQGHDPCDPRASPLFADLAAAPPVWLSVGDTEILLDDARRLECRLRAAGREVELHIGRDLPHAWPLFHGVLPEAGATLARLARWIRRQYASSGDS